MKILRLQTGAALGWDGPARTWPAWGWLLLSVGLGSLAVALQWEFSVFPVDGPHDSLRYLGMAASMLSGDWLGPYDHMTLIRTPVYSALLALSSLFGWRLHVFQQVAYLTSLLLLCLSLRSWGLSGWRIVLIFGLCAFHPLLLYVAGFVTTEAFYVPAAVAVVSGCLGLMRAHDRPAWVWVFWIAVLCFAFPTFWHIRPDGVWILPFLLVCGGFLLRGMVCDPQRRWKRVTLALVLPAAASVSLGHGLAQHNEQRYGLRVTHELAEAEFEEAFRWLTRLAPGDAKPFVPVTRAAMAVAYAYSPQFKRLEPHLSMNVNGQGWSAHGCALMGVCDELAGGWALWAVRDAAAQAGVYRTARDASQFYRDVAAQIRTICEQGLAPCTRNPTGNMLAPPMSAGDLPRVARSLLDMMILTISFGDFLAERKVWERAHGDVVLARRYQGITHDQHFKPGAFAYGRTFDAVIVAYRVLPLVFVLTSVLALAHLAWTGRGRVEGVYASLRRSPVLWLGACLAVYVLGRWMILAYVDAMSFPAQMRYLLVVYPVLMALLVLMLPPWRQPATPGPRGHRG